MDKNIQLINIYYNNNLRSKIPRIVELHTNKLANAITRPEATGEITSIDEYLDYFTKSDYLYTDKLPHEVKQNMMQLAAMEFPEVRTVKMPLLFGNEMLLVDLNEFRALLNEKDLDFSSIHNSNDGKKSLFAIVPYVKKESLKK